MNNLQTYSGQHYISKDTLLLICSYSDMYSCGNLMITCKKFYNYINELTKMHGHKEFSIIDPSKFINLIKYNDCSIDKHIIAEILDIKNLYYFQKHIEIKDILLKNKYVLEFKVANDDSIGITFRLENVDNLVYAYKNSDIGCKYYKNYCINVTNISKYFEHINCPKNTSSTVYDIIRIIKKILPSILSYNKKHISKIHSVILAGRFQKIIIIRKHKKIKNREDIVFNLNCRFKDSN